MEKTADHIERCDGCGWALSLLGGKPGHTYHPPACPKCGSREWSLTATVDNSRRRGKSEGCAA